MKMFHRPSALAFSRMSTRIARVGDVGALYDLLVERAQRLSLVGIDVFVHERADSVPQFDDARAQVEIHRGAS